MLKLRGVVFYEHNEDLLTAIEKMVRWALTFNVTAQHNENGEHYGFNLQCDNFDKMEEALK